MKTVFGLLFGLFICFGTLTLFTLPYTDKVPLDVKLLGCEIRTGSNFLDSSYYCYFRGLDYGSDARVTKLEYEYNMEHKTANYQVMVSHPRFNWFLAGIVITGLLAFGCILAFTSIPAKNVESQYPE